MNFMDYSKRLYDLRIAHDLRQENIANVLKISKQAYGMYENKKKGITYRISYKTLQIL